MSAAPPHPEQQQQPVAAPPTDPETAPEPEEFASETLYIQNLNERIQIPGTIAKRRPLRSSQLTEPPHSELQC